MIHGKPHDARNGWPPADTKVNTAAVKYDDAKSRLDLLPGEALEEIGHVLGFGAHKYAAHNWRGGIVLSRLLAACLRHVYARLRGEKNDPESGRPHLAHAACCLLFAITMEKVHPGKYDDLYKQDPTQ